MSALAPNTGKSVTLLPAVVLVNDSVPVPSETPALKSVNVPEKVPVNGLLGVAAPACAPAYAAATCAAVVATVAVYFKPPTVMVSPGSMSLKVTLVRSVTAATPWLVMTVGAVTAVVLTARSGTSAPAVVLVKTRAFDVADEAAREAPQAATEIAG